MDWDLNLFRSVITIVVMLSFLGICFQAFRSKNRSHFEEAGNLPFLEEPDVENASVYLKPESRAVSSTANSTVSRQSKDESEAKNKVNSHE